MKFLGFKLALFFFAISVSSLYSQDKILLKDGRKLKCFVIYEDSSKVNIIKDDKELILNKQNIRSIYYSYNQDEIIFKNGESINCKVISSDSLIIKYIILENGTAENRRIEMQNIKEINYGIRAGADHKKVLEKKDIYNKLSIDFGSGFAIGDFGNNDINDEKSGLAQTGINYNILLTLKLTQYIGLAIKGIGNSNGLDTKLFKESLGTIYGSWNVVSSKWESKGFMGGIVFCAPSDISFELRLLGGVMTTNSPKVKLMAPNKVDWIEQESVNASALCYNVGIGIDIPIFKKLSMTLNADYVRCKFKFENIEIKSSRTLIAESNSDQIFSVLNCAIGLGYKF